MHTHRCYLVDGFHGYPRVKGSGWFFGTIGPDALHGPQYVPACKLVWFITEDFAVVRNINSLEPITP